MIAYSVSYQFIQSFSVPARPAFRWATDYQSSDLALMGENGKRIINRITDNTIILEEEIMQEKKKSRKIKLVRLNPRSLSWHNIQLRGPNKHSEFIYEISPEGRKRSRLTFTGLLVIYSKNPLNARKLKQIAGREKRYDSNAWKKLAKAMTREL